MSMSTYAVTADIVDAEIVEKVAPTEYRAFMAFEGETTSIFHQASYSDFEQAGLEKATKALYRAFRESTGLTLYMGHLDEDMSERGDDFTGDYFALGGTTEKTTAALMFEKAHDFIIETKFSTTWG